MENGLLVTDSKLLPPFTDTGVTFSCGGKEVMRIGPDGLWYKGELCKDAGEAHRAFMEFMRKANSGL